MGNASLTAPELRILKPIFQTGMTVMGWPGHGTFRSAMVRCATMVILYARVPVLAIRRSASESGATTGRSSMDEKLGPDQAEC